MQFLTGDEAVLDLSIERMVARVVPELALQRRSAATRQQARQLELERRFDAWADVPDGPRTPEMRAETRALNQVLREWFQRDPRRDHDDRHRLQSVVPTWTRSEQDSRFGRGSP